jgi:tetratricopeptide (TPR) repeat protein
LAERKDVTGIGGEPDTGVAWWWSVACEAFQTQNYQGTADICVRLLDWVKSNAPPAELAAVQDLRAQALQRLGRIPEALDAFNLAEDLAEECNPALLQSRNNKAAFLLENGLAAEAVEILKGVLASPEAAELDPITRGYFHDTYGRAILHSGNGTGLKEFAIAGELLRAGTARDRIVNLLFRADAEKHFDRFDEASVHFQEALALARSAVKLGPSDEMRYQEALGRASSVRSSAARSAFEEGIRLWRLGRYTDAQARLRHADAIAIRDGDQWMALRARSQLAGLLRDTRDVDGALSLCRAGLTEARRAGFAHVAATFAHTLAGLISGGVENAGTQTDLLLLLAESEYLTELHRQQHDGTGHTTTERSNVQLALCAKDYGDIATARELLIAAIVDAAARGDDTDEAQWRSSLLSILVTWRERSPNDTELHRAIEDNVVALEALLARDDLDVAVRPHAGIALTDAKLWPPGNEDISTLRDLVARIDQFRAEHPSASASVEVTTHLRVLEQLRRRLSEERQHQEAWETLQRVRARELMEELTSLASDTSPYVPPTVAEAADLLGKTGTASRRPSVLVDVVVTDSGLEAYVVDSAGRVRFIDLPGDSSQLKGPIEGDADSRIAKTRELMRDGLPAELAGRICAVTEGADLLLSVDDSLANLPWSAASVDGRPWSDIQLVGRIPAIAVLRNGANRLSGESFVAGDSLGDLRYARQECEKVAGILGAMPRLGPDCTFGSLEAVSDQALDFLHLAVHGYSDSRRGGLATLVLADLVSRV